MQNVYDNFSINPSVKEEVEQFIIDWYSDLSHIKAMTSGSTGKPKQIQLLKNGMLYSARNTVTYFNLTEKTKALLCLPLTTIGGKMMIVRAIESKMKLNVIKAVSNPLSEWEGRIDFIAVTPMQLSNMLNQSLEKVREIQYILVGGAPMNEGLITQLRDEKITVYHGYGMTETASHVAIKKVGFETDEYYQAMPGIRFEYGENQGLKIFFPALHDNPIITSDQVELANEFQFNWLGRNDFVVNSGGIKIHVEEIENQLSWFIQVPFFVSGIPDTYLGEKLILCIESTDSFTNVDLEFLGVKKPREVYHLASFIYTNSGKLDRKATVNQLKLNQ